MSTTKYSCLRVFTAGRFVALCAAALILVTAVTRESEARGLPGRKANCGCGCGNPGCGADETGGTWYWVRNPEDEKRVVMGLFNRYCIRCHGVDGRGVWDIPGVPDFTNARWQAYHSDGQLVRSILEGRGACMPPFRGTLALDEAWAMSRYLRTFVPGTEVSRPDVTQPAQPAVPAATTPVPPAPPK
jgi:mono/diheme cytochrome c family protein